MLQGDFAAARSSFDKALALQKVQAIATASRESLGFKAGLALRQKDFTLAALRHLKESLALYRNYTTSVWVTRGLVYIAITHIASGQLPLAAQLVGALDARNSAVDAIDTHLGSLASIAEFQNAVASLRSAMPKDVFDREWNEGYKLAAEQSIDRALS